MWHYSDLLIRMALIVAMDTGNFEYPAPVVETGVWTFESS